MWAQVVGKVVLELTPKINHWWNVTFRVSSRGLKTPLMYYGSRVFDAEFDFIRHDLTISTSDGESRSLRLESRSVADFHSEFMECLKSLGVEVSIYGTPVEIPDPIPFAEDTIHASYDREYAQRFWRVLVSCDRVMHEFRSRFIGKCSPVHFFWGSFDMAVSRFSGRRAPERPGADVITREAYSHEVSSVGWWPGGIGVEDAAFYSYTVPEPPGFRDVVVKPTEAFFHQQLGEYILLYEDVRKASSPDRALLEFMQTTYEAGANLGRWDRRELEAMPVARGGERDAEMLAS